MNERPPRLLRRMLVWALPFGAVRDGLLGDLDELYAERVAADRVSADLWYARQVLSAVIHYPLRRVWELGVGGQNPSIAEGLATDLGFTVRTLRRSPGFTAMTVLTLALGTGATTTAFSVINGVLLEPLPFDEPDRLVSIGYTAPGVGIDALDQSHGLHFTYLDESRTFEGVGMALEVAVAVTGDGAPEEVDALLLTHTMLPTLRVRPMLGRGFDEHDDAAGAPGTVVLGHAHWRTRFGGDPDVIGRTVMIDREPHEIIGVMPARLRFLDYDPALYLPFRFGGEELYVGNFSHHGVARLRPGVTIDQANADVEHMIPLALQRYPTGLSEAIVEQMRLSPRLRPLKEHAVGEASALLWLLFGAVGIVLVITCVNIANLFLVRAGERHRDTSLRAALGASRSVLARGFLVESMTLALLGGAIGVLLAHGGVTLLHLLARGELPRLAGVALRPPELLFAFGLALAAGLLFGLVSLLCARHARGGDLGHAGGRSVGVGRRHGTVRDTLVTAQLAFALVLLVGAGLIIRSLVALGAVHPGFERPDEVLTVRINIPIAEMEEPAHVVLALEQMLGKLEAIPGVVSVGASSRVPLDGSLPGGDPLYVEAFPLQEGQVPPVRRYKFILPGYFETLQTPVLAGRSITWADIEARAPVVVVTRNLALEYWDRVEDAIGQRVRPAVRPGSDDEPWREIIGVVGDVRDNGVAQDPVAIAYWPVINETFWGEEPWLSRSMALTIRTSRPRSVGFVDEVSTAIWAVNANLPLANVRTLQQILARSMARTSFMLVMLGIAAAAALLLGAVGIYGATSCAVAQRRRELGVRMALGARRGDVARLVLRHSLLLAVMGVTAGIVMALSATHLLSALLYGVSAVDPLTFAAMTAFVLGTAMLATWVPVRRAARLDPTMALRE